MHILDFIILLCFIPAVLNGLRKGFIAQVFSIVSIIAGVWLSFKFASLVSTWIGQWINGSEQVLLMVSFLLIFAAVITVLSLLSKTLEACIKIIFLGWLNKLLGVAFSMAKCLLIVGLALTVFDSLNMQFDFIEQSSLDKTLFYTPISKMTEAIFPYFKEMF